MSLKRSWVWKCNKTLLWIHKKRIASFIFPDWGCGRWAEGNELFIKMVKIMNSSKKHFGASLGLQSCRLCWNQTHWEDNRILFAYIQVYSMYRKYVQNFIAVNSISKIDIPCFVFMIRLRAKFGMVYDLASIYFSKRLTLFFCFKTSICGYLKIHFVIFSI